MFYNFWAVWICACVLITASGAASAQDAKVTKDKNGVPVIDLPPPDWPGAGNIKDWYAACQLNDQANQVMKDAVSVDGSCDRKLVTKSADLYKQAIAKYPFETAFYDGLASCYRTLGDDKLAEVEYRKSIEVKEKYRGPGQKIRYPDTYLALIELCIKHKEFNDADLNFKKVLKVTPEDRELWTSYGQFLKKQKRFSESDAAFKKAKALEEEENRRNPRRPGEFRYNP